MTDHFVVSWHMILYPLAAIGYFELIRRLDRRWAERTPLTDDEILAAHARQSGISEYEVFRRAAPHWSVSPARVDEDLKAYLRHDRLPHYVRAYVRHIRQAQDLLPKGPN